MIAATVLQEDYRRHLNRRNTDCEKSISIADGDAYINEAIDVIFENFAVKFETNDLLRNHLRQLEVAEYEVPVEKNDKIFDCKQTFLNALMSCKQYIRGKDLFLI